MPGLGDVRGAVCLQGGGELSPGCEAMDAMMLARPDGEPRRVVVLPFAGRPGREQAMASANARRWYLGLGAQAVRTVSPDPGALTDALADADLLVIPGGSPSRLLEALAPHADLLRAARAAGLAIRGASAGAMVLCRWTVLPEGGAEVVPALGLVDVDLVVPHYRPGARAWLERARPVLPAAPAVLGLPERSGVVLGVDGTRVAVGVAPVVDLGSEDVQS